MTQRKGDRKREINKESERERKRQRKGRDNGRKEDRETERGEQQDGKVMSKEKDIAKRKYNVCKCRDPTKWRSHVQQYPE